MIRGTLPMEHRLRGDVACIGLCHRPVGVTIKSNYYIFRICAGAFLSGKLRMHAGYALELKAFCRDACEVGERYLVSDCVPRRG